MVAGEESVTGQHPALGRGEAGALPVAKGNVALDGNELIERVGERARLLLEVSQGGQLEQALLGLLVPLEVLRHPLQRLEPSGLKAGQ